MPIQPEQPADIAAIDAVLQAAFPTAAEAQVVELLRRNRTLAVSLVAVVADRIVGQVALSPVTVAGGAGGLGLVPLAVLPEFQRRGIGGELVQVSLRAAMELGTGFVVVLGEPRYYERFGFRRASEFGLSNEYGVDEEFMVTELSPGAIPVGGGLVKYGAEFALFTE